MARLVLTGRRARPPAPAPAAAAAWLAAARRGTEWVWPAGVPLTPRRAFPDVARLVLRSWAPALAGAALAALAGVAPWGAAATVTVSALLVAVEETAHLAVAARLAPAARFALVTRFPLRAAARIRPALAPRPAAAAALAGPLAAAAAGLVVVTLPLAARNLLPATPRADYSAWAPALVPPLWLIAAAVPLPGSDLAVARAARAPLPAVLRESVRLLCAVCSSADRR